LLLRSLVFGTSTPEPMRRSTLSAALLAIFASSVAAAQAPLPPATEQISAAVLPLPTELRAGATVMGYKTAGKLEVLRAGTNGMNCLALYVTRPDFHVACYHQGLEAFMARGRELREQGVRGFSAIDSVRFKEITEGKLKMPKAGALYSLTGKKEAWDATKGTATGASQLSVVYMPFATMAETGITETPRRSGEPWLMFPGTVKAHMMLVGTMAP
jgi:hypothetical protein